MPKLVPVDHDPFPQGAAFGVGSPSETSQQPAGLSDFIGGLYDTLGNISRRALGSAQHFADTGQYDAGPILEAATLPMGTGAIAGVPVRAGEAVLGAGPIRAYHGSPHDFDAFSMDKIGTGEGAQAYGHGIYVAENPSVAESYRTAGPAGNVPAPTYEAPSDVLSRHAEDFGQFAVSNPLLVKGFGSLDVKGRGDVLPMMRGLLQDPEIAKAVVRLVPTDVMHMLGGKELTTEKLLHDPSMLVDLLPGHANDLVPSRVKAMDELAPYVASATAKRPLIGPQSTSMLEEALAARNAGKGDLHVRSEIPYPTKSGKMYEVNINADPEHFLDWDKPLSEQGDKVRSFVDELEQRRKSELANVDPSQFSDYASFDAAHGAALDRAAKLRVNPNWTGQHLIDSMAQLTGDSLDTLGLNHAAASQALRDAGIPGIKYLDQGSRNVPKLLAAHEENLASAKSPEVRAMIQEKIDALKNQGSRNYVVFDDKTVEIIKKYGLAGLSMLPPATAAAISQKIKPVDHDPFVREDKT